MTEHIDLSALENSEHLLALLHPQPATAIMEFMEQNLNQQIPGTVIEQFVVKGEPQWLTKAAQTSNEVTNLGVAFGFAMAVVTPDDQTYHLTGVFSWVGIDLDQPQSQQQRMWVDLEQKMEAFVEQNVLSQRLLFNKD